MGKGFKCGVSLYSPLNFRVIRYKTEEELLAATPEENTIGVVATYSVSGWTIDGQEPQEPSDYQLWIQTGLSSEHTFNALKEESLYLHPLAVWHYVGGSWRFLNAFSGRDGQWHYWWNGQLYSDGNLVERITGGWEGVADAGDTGLNAAAPTVVNYSSYIQAKLSSYRGRGCLSTVNAVDVTSFTQLRIYLNNRKINNGSAHIELVDTEGNSLLMEEITAAGESTFDISALTGKCYVRFTLAIASFGSVTLGVRSVLLL